MEHKESAGSVIWRVIYPLLIFLAAEFVVELAILIPKVANIVTANSDLLEDADALSEYLMDYVTRLSLYITIGRAVILVPIFLLLMRRDRNVVDRAYGRYREYGPFKKTWLLLLPVAGFTAAMGFNHVVPMVINGIEALIKAVFGRSINLFATYESVSEVIYSGSVFVQILAAAIAAPLVEELLFRGLIFKRIRARFGFAAAAIWSALIFGIIHGNFVQFLYAFIIGLFLAYVYEKFKTIWASVIFHAGANFIAVIVTFITNDEELGVPLGLYVLIIVTELVATFAILWVIETRFKREEIVPQDKVDNQ